MNTTTTSQKGPYEVAVTNGFCDGVPAAVLRLAADLADMYGHEVHYSCGKGFSADGKLSEVRITDEDGRSRVAVAIRQSFNGMDTGTFRASMCKDCHVSAVVTLGGE